MALIIKKKSFLKLLKRIKTTHFHTIGGARWPRIKLFFSSLILCKLSLNSNFDGKTKSSNVYALLKTDRKSVTFSVWRYFDSTVFILLCLNLHFSINFVYKQFAINKQSKIRNLKKKKNTFWLNQLQEVMSLKILYFG